MVDQSEQRMVAAQIGRELGAIRVTIAESPVARAWYEAPLW